jgi:hypothetical protein
MQEFNAFLLFLKKDFTFHEKNGILIKQFALGYSQVGKAMDSDSIIAQVRVLLSQPVGRAI